MSKVKHLAEYLKHLDPEMEMAQYFVAEDGVHLELEPLRMDHVYEITIGDAEVGEMSKASNGHIQLKSGDKVLIVGQ